MPPAAEDHGRNGLFNLVFVTYAICRGRPPTLRTFCSGFVTDAARRERYGSLGRKQNKYFLSSIRQSFYLHLIDNLLA